MKTTSIFKTSLLLALALGGVSTGQTTTQPNACGNQIAQDNTVKTALPEAVKNAIATGNYVHVEQVLIDQLKVLNITPDCPTALEMAMLLEYIRTTNANIMTQFAAKCNSRAKFLATLATDTEWLKLNLNCGLVPYKTDVGIDVLYRIWVAEKEQVQNKALAAALASAWGGGETDPEPHKKTKNPDKFNPVWRYQFFVKNAKAGKLHPNFKNLQPWELRFVVGNPWQDWDDLSFEYALENINVPWDQYQNSCWSATYTDPSKFGDTVQGGMYNLPYSSQSQAEACHRNGGVCGAMSHLGCVTAQAHGIPAYTVGQPGHCAYAVRIKRGEWVGGFGGPDGGMHNRIFGNKAPTSYRLMESVFADDATINKAYDTAHCARALTAVGNVPAAIAMWQKALDISPLHPFFRTALYKLMAQQGLTPNQAYDYLNKTIPLYKEHGFAAVDMAGDFKKEIAAMNDDQKLRLYNLQHELIANTPSSWAVNCNKLIQEQSDSLADDKAKEQFLGSALATHINATDATTFGQLLEWAVKTYVEKGKESIFSQAFSKAVASASGNTTATNQDNKAAEERTKKLTAAYGKAIIAAEQARSATAFQALTTAAEVSCGKCPINIPLTTSVPGQPIKAAMFRISTTSPYDAPHRHYHITTPMGGQCHTSKEKTPHMVVELPQRQYVSGCIVRKRNGYESRMKKATIYTSEDGATWVARQSTGDMPKEWAVTFTEGTPAKWLKVEFDNGATEEFAHISHFVVFGK